MGVLGLDHISWFGNIILKLPNLFLLRTLFIVRLLNLYEASVPIIACK